MAIKLSSHKCIDCSGLLEFNKAEKRFECPYCGKIYEKDYQFEKVQIDGVATTNETIRATLLNIVSDDLDMAKKNFQEAEKLNFDYIGTKLAGLAYYRFLSFKANEKQIGEITAKMKSYANDIKKAESIDESESDLYSFFNQADIYAVLYISLISSGLKERAEFVANYLEFDNILNVTLNKYMLKLTLQFNAYDEADKILKNIKIIDKKYSLFLVLKYYKDSPMKREHIDNLFSNSALTYKDVNLVTKYFEETKDSSSTKLRVAVHALDLKMKINISDLLSNIMASGNSIDDMLDAFENLKNIKLTDEDTNLVLNFILGPKCKSADLLIKGLDSLKENGSLYSITPERVVYYLGNTGVPIIDYILVLDYILDNFKMTPKHYEILLDYFLNKVSERSIRKNLIDSLLKHCSSININTLNNYLISTIDGDKKPEIFSKILKFEINKAYFSGILSKYLIENKDSIDTVFKMMELLKDKDDYINGAAFNKMLICIRNVDDFRVLNTFRVDYKRDCLDLYIKSKSNYEDEIIEKLLEKCSIIQPSTVVNYIRNSKSQAKANFAQEMLSRTNCSEYGKYNCNYLNYNLNCNYMQQYLFVSDDNISTKLLIMKKMESIGFKLSENMEVDCKKMPFKKFIVKNKDNIEPDIDKICNELGVYKLFF